MRGRQRHGGKAIYCIASLDVAQQGETTHTLSLSLSQLLSSRTGSRSYLVSLRTFWSESLVCQPYFFERMPKPIRPSHPFINGPNIEVLLTFSWFKWQPYLANESVVLQYSTAQLHPQDNLSRRLEVGSNLKLNSQQASSRGNRRPPLSMMAQTETRRELSTEKQKQIGSRRRRS